jgi:hypothetical protein
LGDLGLAQLLVSRGGRRRISRVDEHVVAERTAQERRHHLVGFCEGVGDDRLLVAQGGEHVHVLRALARVEEGHRCRCPSAHEHTLVAQRAPHRWLVRLHRLDGPVDLGGQVGGVVEVDGEADRGSKVGLGGR